MIIPRKRIKLALIHTFVWIFYIAYEASILVIVDSADLNLLETGSNFFLYALIFYINSLVLLPRFFAQQKYFRFIVSLLALGIGFVALRYCINVYLIPSLGQQMLRPFSSQRLFWAQTLWRGGYFFILSVGYWFALNSVQSERRRRAQEQQLQEMEKNLMEAELAYLKTQINPHFLFNALNFLYSQVYPLSESTAKGILLLSDIMRYAIKEEHPSGKVMLEKEVQHLKNYIAINQLRFGNHLQVKFETTGNWHFRMIMPLVLITFVENCFKHGDLFDATHPIVIKLEVINDQLFFFTYNKKRVGPKEKSTGVGLANIQKGLDIMYVNRYTLNILNEPDFFTCQLTINL